jgi:hypothetical protein
MIGRIPELIPTSDLLSQDTPNAHLFVPIHRLLWN